MGAVVYANCIYGVALALYYIVKRLVFETAGMTEGGKKGLRDATLVDRFMYACCVYMNWSFSIVDGVAAATISLVAVRLGC